MTQPCLYLIEPIDSKLFLASYWHQINWVDWETWLACSDQVYLHCSILKQVGVDIIWHPFYTHRKKIDIIFTRYHTHYNEQNATVDCTSILMEITYSIVIYQDGWRWVNYWNEFSKVCFVGSLYKTGFISIKADDEYQAVSLNVFMTLNYIRPKYVPTLH